MPIYRPEQTRDQRSLLAFVEASIDSDRDRPHSRMSLHLDAIDESAFRRAGSLPEDAKAFTLARVLTTPGRFDDLFGFKAPNEAEWIRITLVRRPNMPRAWLFPETDGYLAGPAINAVSAESITLDSDLAKNLEAACVVEGVAEITAKGLTHRIAQEIKGRDIEVVALDVGQAAAVAFKENDRCLGYFDAGAPLFFNQRSFPANFFFSNPQGGFVILSHWDFDHFALAYKHPELMNVDWYAPRQPVGPNTARFQKKLGNRLTFIKGSATSPSITLQKCRGQDSRDRNSTGYVMRIRTKRSALLTGDADYQFIPRRAKRRISSVVIPHHGGAGAGLPPRPVGRQKTAVASYGEPNTYRHPNFARIRAHQEIGWRVSRTATYGVHARGDRPL